MNQFSGILIPIVALMIPIVAIIAGAYTSGQAKRARTDQTMAMIARGIPMAEIEAFLKRQPGDARDRGGKDPLRSLASARRAATVLISVGIGLTAFFLLFGVVALHHIDHEAGWAMIACSGAGLIPLGIGVGFLVDYRMQQRELARFGLELEPGKL